MTENINKRPSKSILKSSASIERQEIHPSSSKKAKEQRFDEMNIIATLHPPDKDYGHMKIEEPKTPYSEYSDPDLNPTRDEIDANILAAKLAAGMNNPRPDYSSSSEEDDNETPEERRIRLEFQDRRKKHYNEFQAIKLARKLMEDDDDDGSSENTMETSDANACQSASKGSTSPEAKQLKSQKTDP